MDSYDQHVSQVGLPRQCSPNNLRFCLHAFVQQLMVISSTDSRRYAQRGQSLNDIPRYMCINYSCCWEQENEDIAPRGEKVNQRSFVEEDSSASRLRTGRRPRPTGKYLNLSAPLLAREFEERHAML